jgi:hypothetical protein
MLISTCVFPICISVDCYLDSLECVTGAVHSHVFDLVYFAFHLHLLVLGDVLCNGSHTVLYHAQVMDSVLSE